MTIKAENTFLGNRDRADWPSPRNRQSPVNARFSLEQTVNSNPMVYLDSEDCVRANSKIVQVSRSLDGFVVTDQG